MLQGLRDRFQTLTRGRAATADMLETVVTASGPQGDIGLPSEGDGVWKLSRAVDGSPCIAAGRQADGAHFLYFTIPDAFRERATNGLHVTIEYFGQGYAPFWVQYASTDHGAPHDGLYKPALEFWVPETDGALRFRRALFPMRDFDPSRRQNCGASFRVEARKGALIRRVSVSLKPPADEAAFSGVAPVPWLPSWERTPERFSSIQFLFVELTNACNFKCTWCPDAVMTRKRGFMKKEQAFQIQKVSAELQL